ncbi:MAG: Sporulation-specific N-acetylmuramoyl-L-alanine amidase [Actinobacteria bacterium ADurb.Bin346]|nr:MAG: Sporulation-specific N-acetylmuramoyl-L-alanine amidase [Actinobacteria bacterium ADurb.Bin346]
MASKKGFSGAKVVEVQRRLKSLGYDLGRGEIDGLLGPSTSDAVRKFQQDRGIDATGKVDAQTWQELLDAGYRVGDRMLYLKNPPFRGDDVRTLQLWLKTLGFYKYKENGIFCDKTHKALIEFQKNMKIHVDGILGGSTLRHFNNLKRIIDSRKSSNYPAVKEYLKIKEKGAFKIIFDYGENISDSSESLNYFKDKIYICKSVAGFCRDILTRAGVESSVTVNEEDNSSIFLEDRIKTANRSNADILVSLNLGFSCDGDANGSSCYYFEGMRSYSVPGKVIANLIQDNLIKYLSVLDCRVHGANYTILKETVMTAVLIEPAFISNNTDRKNLLKTDYQMGISNSIAEALSDFLQDSKYPH